MKPEKTAPIANPIDPNRKIEPAWAVVIRRSRDIYGNKGAKINRLKKERKNRKAIKMTFPITEFKGAGTGQVLLDIAVSFRRHPRDL